MDLYNILEIEPNASEIEIKKAYHKLAKIYHPDKNKDINASEKFQKIQSAYEILSNDKTRQEYQKMNRTDRLSFVEILEKIINDNKLNVNELKKYGINLEKSDIDYIQKNIINFFNTLNVNELLDLFKKGVVPRKEFNNIINCSESDTDIYDEIMAEYFYFLPFSFQKINNNDIKIDLNINISDIVNNNKRKIKIKRKIDGNIITSTFIFNLSKPYVIFIGGGDMNNSNYGNLFIKLSLPNNLYWDQNIILIEQSMSLYDMIYGLDVCLDLGDNQKINIQKWVPSRDGYLVEISKNNIKELKLMNHNLTIKLVLDYESTDEKEELLKQYFSK
jgi:curved DNA-binding protein CbpA